MFSGPADAGPHRPGAGPTLGEWWAQDDPAGAEPEGYAPRAVYGRYLTYVMRRIEETLPPSLTVHRVPAHPDDECVGTGGSIARRVAEGVRVPLVTSTDGAEGEVHHPNLDPE